jgi:16S rRNA processing protein RimM
MLQVPETSPWHGKSVVVKELRWYNNLPVVFLEGVEDRTAAETLIKAILLIEQETAQLPVEPDAWYDHQLVGLKVIREGVEIGQVTRVDVEKSQILITPPGGLFEEIAESQDAN